jgi:serine/threonine protein kinase
MWMSSERLMASSFSCRLKSSGGVPLMDSGPALQIDAGSEVGLYRIIERFGQGGMATVFKAHHSVLKRDAALKFLHPAFLEDPEFVRRFRHEARMIAGLEHPNIVPVFDFAEHDGLPYLAMKFVEGETLKARLARGPVSIAETTRILQAVAQGLAYAHMQGILHRDIKPSNILLGEDQVIYLVDFGIARIAASAQSTLSSEMLIGTPQYMSPEQARSDADLDGGTDIYSLGIVLYELLVGDVPFDADTPISIIHDHLYTPPELPRAVFKKLPKGLEQVISIALSKKREDRYESAEDMLAAYLEAVGVDELPDESEPSEDASADLDPERGSPQPVPARLQAAGNIEFPLSGERMLVGRQDPDRGVTPEIDLTDAEPLDEQSGKRRKTVHREQAWITWEHGAWGIEVMVDKQDRAWMNGERLNAGQRYPLAEGDRLKFGAVEVVFHLEEAKA